MTRQTQWPLVVLIALFVLLGVIYSLVTPVFEASDELSHYPVVREIAEGRGLPVVHPGEEEPWRQEGTQPPLYYALSAALTFWLDTSDMEEVLWRNPHATIGVPLAYGNKNMIIHTDKERFPWHGSVLAVYLIRFLSVLLGASTVFLTWRLGHELGPGCPEVALAAAALVAFNPMFLFVTGSVNNDNLAVLLGTLTVWLLATVLRHGVTGQRLVILGLLLGLGAITKLSLLGLLPLAAVTLAYVAWQQRALLSPLIRWWLTLLGMVLVIAGWWYVRNWQLYGDPLALNVHLDAVGRRAFVPDWRKLLGEWEGFRISYWGLFGGVNVLAPGAMYKAFDLLLLFGLLGLPLAVWRLWRDQQRDSLTGLALLAAWVITVLVSLTHWTRLTPASQGRLMFPAIAAISILLASGLLALVPRRWRSLTAGVLSLGMATWAALLPFVVIVPAYARPSMLNQADVPPELPRINVTHAGVLRLLAADVETHTVRVGEPVRFTLYWQAVAETSTDYSVFVHLLGSNGEVVGSIGTYPG
ncbi:MAG: glycosyltransferase family 39 protein, partial [Ardenticatenia bacterium]|nr:glycosyltransferase family 39 protein [Ardenticatenia bacterium]